MQIQKASLNKNKFQAMVVPMFLESKTDDKMVDKPAEKQETQEISLFDVKELYDLAYTKPSDSEEFKSILAEAVHMDMAYRRQLQENTSYKGPFGTYGQQETKIKKAGEAA